MSGVGEPDFYGWLGVPPSASAAEIDFALRALEARATPHEQPWVQAAAETLRDPQRRLEYDARRRGDWVAPKPDPQRPDAPPPAHPGAKQVLQTKRRHPVRNLVIYLVCLAVLIFGLTLYVRSTEVKLPSEWATANGTRVEHGGSHLVSFTNDAGQRVEAEDATGCLICKPGTKIEIAYFRSNPHYAFAHHRHYKATNLPIPIGLVFGALLVLVAIAHTVLGARRRAGALTRWE